MECQQFLSRFSEFIDGRTGALVSRKMEAHREACEGCRRYAKTVEAGIKLLRDAPSPEFSPDFRARLDHMIFHVEDGASIARQSLGSGATLFSVLAVAVLVSISAWAPRVNQGETYLELPPILVAEPEDPHFTPRPPPPSFRRNLAIFTTAEFQDGIWGDPHEILREYSPILDGRRDSQQGRVGIE